MTGADCGLGEIKDGEVFYIADDGQTHKLTGASTPLAEVGPWDVCIETAEKVLGLRLKLRPSVTGAGLAGGSSNVAAGAGLTGGQAGGLGIDLDWLQAQIDKRIPPAWRCSFCGTERPAGVLRCQSCGAYRGQ